MTQQYVSDSLLWELGQESSSFAVAGQDRFCCVPKKMLHYVTERSSESTVSVTEYLAKSS